MSPISAVVDRRCRLDWRVDAGNVGHEGSSFAERRPWLTGLPDFATGVYERGLCVRENTGFLRAQVNRSRKTLSTTRNVRRRQGL